MVARLTVVRIPHFDLPFRLDSTGHGVVTEQDHYQDISNCVEVVLRTQKGSRLYVPNFGIDDPTFQAPVDLRAIEQQILINEPRGHVVITDRLGVDSLVDEIRVQVENG